MQGGTAQASGSFPPVILPNSLLWFCFPSLRSAGVAASRSFCPNPDNSSCILVPSRARPVVNQLAIFVHPRQRPVYFSRAESFPNVLTMPLSRFFSSELSCHILYRLVPLLLRLTT